MDSDIRIPTEWLLALADQIRANPDDFAEIKFISAGGNVLVAWRVRGKRQDGTEFDSWDFAYNPGD